MIRNHAMKTAVRKKKEKKGRKKKKATLTASTFLLEKEKAIVTGRDCRVHLDLMFLRALLFHDD